jgi:large subunit ribosomal protein L7/L12
MFLSNRVAQRVCLAQTFRQGLRRNLIATQAACFSEDAQQPAEEAKAPAAEPTAAEVAASQNEWGIKYDDECLKFEKEWQEIAERVQNENMVYLKSELSDLQKKKVEMLADKVLDFNMVEHRYFHHTLSERIQRTSGMNMMKLNLDWPSLKKDGTGTWPPANPNWFKQQELMSSLGPFMGSMGGGMGGGAAQAGPAAAAEVAPKEEVAKEKTHFDIELTKFDPAGKIKVIKEIRAIFNLGLKEAKETVEGAPVWLKKEVAKEEAEALAEKLKSVGAEIRLA